jgi:hypothetical protein
MYIHIIRWRRGIFAYTKHIYICRLKGSTLQVMGVGIEDGDQWAILSGTGQFTMAQGFIKKKLHSYVTDGTIIELDLYAVFQPTKVRTTTYPRVSFYYWKIIFVKKIDSYLIRICFSSLQCKILYEWVECFEIYHN